MQRLLEKCVVRDDCLIWTGHKKRDGYGYAKIKGKHQGVHRIFFRFFNGPILPGLVVMHSCDVKLCCNPAHLELGTPQKNSSDALTRGLIKRPLKKNIVQQIRKNYVPYKVPLRVFAKRFGLSMSVVAGIVSNSTYKDF